MGSERDLLHGDLTGVIRQTAYDIHVYFGTGYLEKVYENALANRLNKQGFCAEQQRAVEVRDEDGTVVGEYFADLTVNDLVMVELKAVSKLAPEHTAQVINYMRATGFQVGVLINFGSARFEFKRFVLDRAGKRPGS